MKSLTDVNLMLDVFNQRYGLDVSNAAQGSAAWFTLKLGVLSASNAHKIVAKKDSETRATYMAELVSQVGTGIMEEINSKHLDWGNEHEDAARSRYEFITGNSVTELPFVFKDKTFRAGCSPDGFVSATKGVEIKCLSNSANYVKFLTDDKMKSEWQWQAQFTLWVTDANEWDFVQYDPRMKKNALKVLPTMRDLEKMKTFDDAVPQFIADMDKMLERAGFSFGEQWTRIMPVKEEAS